MKSNLPDELLEKYMNNFWGYGDLSADYWFIGMEEGGGNRYQELVEQIIAWDNLGRKKVVDIQAFQRGTGGTNWFEQKPGKPNIQKTWGPLIRVLLSFKGYPEVKFGNEEIRDYQATLLGKKAGETCLMEILPLPSKKANDWIYGGKSGLAYLADRNSYSDKMFPRRVASLRSMMIKHRPKFVLCYGGGQAYYPKWCEVAGKPLRKEKLMGQTVSFDFVDGVTFALMPHPLYKKREFLNEIGCELARRVKGSSG